LTLEYLQSDRKIAAKLKFENGRNIFTEINGTDLTLRMPDGIVPIGPVEDFGSVVIHDPDLVEPDMLKRLGVIDGFILAVGTVMLPTDANAVWYNGQDIYNFDGSSFDIRVTHEVLKVPLAEFRSTTPTITHFRLFFRAAAQDSGHF